MIRSTMYLRSQWIFAVFLVCILGVASQTMYVSNAQADTGFTRQLDRTFSRPETARAYLDSFTPTKPPTLRTVLRISFIVCGATIGGICASPTLIGIPVGIASGAIWGNFAYEACEWVYDEFCCCTTEQELVDPSPQILNDLGLGPDPDAGDSTTMELPDGTVITITVDRR